MSRIIIEQIKRWPRNLSTSQGGGLSTSQYGGMSTSQYGGLSTSQYGGLSTAQYGGLIDIPRRRQFSHTNQMIMGLIRRGFLEYHVTRGFVRTEVIASDLVAQTNREIASIAD